MSKVRYKDCGARAPKTKNTPEIMLYIVATPIGNLSDISERALEILKSVDFVLCEDTRHSRVLLERYSIRNTLISYFEHNQSERIAQILPRLAQGENAALISDAGMPAVSDPGQKIVKACHDSHIPISVIPGPNAAVCAVAASGFECESFRFCAFFPRKNKDRSELFKEHLNRRELLVGYESPNRVIDLLESMKDNLGAEWKIVSCRELSKKFESIRRGSVEDILTHFYENEPKGEFCFVIDAAKDSEDNEISPDFKRLAALMRDKGISNRDMKAILSTYFDLNPKDVYRSLCNEDDSE